MITVHASVGEKVFVANVTPASAKALLARIDELGDNARNRYDRIDAANDFLVAVLGQDQHRELRKIRDITHRLEEGYIPFAIQLAETALA